MLNVVVFSNGVCQVPISFAKIALPSEDQIEGQNALKSDDQIQDQNAKIWSVAIQLQNQNKHLIKIIAKV